MQDIVITIEQLSKRYRKLGNSNTGDVIKALDRISIKVQRGERICLIGSNGSGKSTLLGILSGVLKPSDGQAIMRGTVISILEIGAGFIQELSGRSNAAMYVKLNGGRNAQAKEVIEQIKLFSGLDDAFDYPIKTYSKGMQLRLAFAAAFYGEGDIYLIDEVMNVGDESFRHKIQLFFDRLIAQKKTILLATHNKQEVMGFSTKCVWLEEGVVKAIDEPQLIIPEYSKYQRIKFETEAEKQDLKDMKPGKVHLPENDADVLHLHLQQPEFENEHLSLKTISVSGMEGNNKIDRAAPVKIRITLYKKMPGYSLSVSMKVQDEFDTPVFYLLSIANQKDENQDNATTRDYRGQLTFECVIPPNLLSTGIYFVSLWVGKNIEPKQPHYNERAYFFPDRFAFRISSGKPQFISEPVHYPVQPVFEWNIKKEV